MPALIDPLSLSFDEANEYFRGKLNLPTEKYTDLWEGMHARAFVVAGATKDALLADFRSALDRAIDGGTTLEQFRTDFDAIVARHGWSYRGGRGWRSRVIYDTNVRTAYQAGRYKQQTDPDVLRSRPYLQYVHGDSANPRPMHESWDGIVLPADHPWWQTHYAPNGWGCTCTVHSLSRDDLEALGKDGPDTPPDDGTYEWTSKDGTRHGVIPNGIDPGWAYNPGEAAWGKPLSQDVMSVRDAGKAESWERLTPGDWRSEQRPEKVPLDPPAMPLADLAATRAELADSLRTVLGGEERVFVRKFGDFTSAVNVNAQTLAEHIDLERSRYVSLLPSVLDEPFEVWLSFERHKESGLVRLRQRYVKAVDVGKGKSLLAIVNVVRGQLEAWTFFPSQGFGYTQRQRAGKLLYGR